MGKRLRSIYSRILGTISGRQLEQDFKQELESHLGMLAEENIHRGMAPEEAERAARIRLGSLVQLKETNRELHGLPIVETLLQDARYALRMLRKNPSFTAIAILTLALGIGANTAIFSVVDAVILRPLPYPSPAQLVNVFEQRPQKGVPPTGPSYPELEDWRAQSRSFRYLAALAFHKLTLTGRGEPTVVNTVVVTSDFFPLLEVKPLIGRTLLSDDFQRGAAGTVVLSENLWRSQFGADPRIIGSSISLDQRSFTVVGIMPAGFRSPFFTAIGEIWIPIAQDPTFSSFMTLRGARGFPLLGRLKPGVSLVHADAEINAIGAALAKQFPEADAGFSIRIEPLKQAIVGDSKVALLILLGAVGLVLLIACANIANLLLARATARIKEMGIRIMLGAGRARIVRQLLTESTLLGLAGGIAGVLLAYWGVSALISFLPAELPQPHPIAVDSRVLAFALVLSVAAGLVFGLAPRFWRRCEPAIQPKGRCRTRGRAAAGGVRAVFWQWRKFSGHGPGGGRGAIAPEFRCAHLSRSGLRCSPSVDRRGLVAAIRILKAASNGPPFPISCSNESTPSRAYRIRRWGLRSPWMPRASSISLSPSWEIRPCLEKQSRTLTSFRSARIISG